jgi:hypothetical protein
MDDMKKILFSSVVMCLFFAQAAEFAVKPRTCYEVSFKARVTRGPCIEKSPQLAAIVPMCVSRPNVTDFIFAGVRWRFFDAKGSVIPRPHEGASAQTLFSAEWKNYRCRFWTPEKAAKVELAISAGAKSNRAELGDVSLVEIPSPQSLVFNPDFSAADDAAPGWQLVGSAVFHNLEPGRSEVNTLDGHVNGDLFPVLPGSRIEVGAVCRNPVVLGTRRDFTNIRVEFYQTYADAAKKGARNKALSETALSVSGNPGKASRRYVVPPTANWARLSAWHGIVEKVSVSVVQDGGAK